MPEGAEIRRVAYVLDNEFKGMLCCNVVILPKYRKAYENGLYSSTQLNYKQFDGYKQVDIGLILKEVKSKGKKIIFDFDLNGTDTLCFVSGLGMNGIWSLNYSKNTALIVNFNGKSAFYEETYIGGNFSICFENSLEWHHIFKDVGPDIMSNEVTIDVFAHQCRNRNVGRMSIYDFFMKQKYLSGCGNWVCADLFYRCQINPNRLMQHVSDSDIYNLFNWSKKILWDSYNLGGLTIRDYVDPYGQTGNYDTVCYGKSFDQFGNQIIKEENKSGRKMHYCPAVQPY